MTENQKFSLDLMRKVVQKNNTNDSEVVPHWF
jgi:hypothetical protein